MSTPSSLLEYYKKSLCRNLLYFCHLIDPPEEVETEQVIVTVTKDCGAPSRHCGERRLYFLIVCFLSYLFPVGRMSWVSRFCWGAIVWIK